MKICIQCQQRFADEGWRCPHCGWVPKTLDGHRLLFEHEDNGEISGYSGEYFAPLAKLEKGHFWFEGRNRNIVWALQKFFPNMTSFLEIGCGTGFVLSAVREAFPNIQIAAGEYYAQGLTFAKQRVPSATFYQLNALSMPFDSEFDVIGAFDVIEHIKDDERVLSQMFQAVKPGGGIALTVPQHRFLWSVADEYKHHERRYERRELVEKVERIGFQVMYATSFVSLFLPAMLLSRLKQNSAEERPDRLTEIDIGPTVNKILNPVMRFETSLIKSGVNWAAGGSLLLIAKRGSAV
jgi:SAM-dependent methyltransferase